MGGIAFGEMEVGKGHAFHTKGLAAGFTVEMQMGIGMVAIALVGT